MGNENVTDLKDAIYQKMESFEDEEKKPKKEKDPGISFYTMIDCKDLPKPVMSETIMSLKTLCQIITKGMQTFWHDYYKTSFYMAPGGFLQMLMIFADNPNPLPKSLNGESTVKIKNVKTIYKEEQDIITAMMTNSANKQRRTLELTEMGKLSLSNFMIRNSKGGIKWNECIEEREFNTTDLIRYPSGKFNGLVVKNVQVTSILDVIWTPIEIQQADYDRAFNNAVRNWIKEEEVEIEDETGKITKKTKKTIKYPEGWNKARVLKEMAVERSYATQLVFKGYRLNDQRNNPVGFDANPRLTPNMVLDFENYFVCVSVTDMEVYKQLINPNFVQSGGIVNCF